MVKEPKVVDRNYLDHGINTRDVTYKQGDMIINTFEEKFFVKQDGG